MAPSGTGSKPQLSAAIVIVAIAMLSLPQPAKAQSRRATVPAPATSGDDFKTFNNPTWARFGGNPACVMALDYDDWSPYGEPDVVRLRQVSTVVARAVNFCKLQGYPYLIPGSFDIQRLSDRLTRGGDSICNDERLADPQADDAKVAQIGQVTSKFFFFTTLTCSLLKPTPDSNPNLVQELKGYKVGQKVFFVNPARDASYGDLEIQALNRKDLTARVMSSKAESVMTVQLADLKADQTSGVSK